MSVDFTNLNKTWPKDPYPLANIDSLVDNTSRCGLLSFLDDFSGYNQIRMHPSDECKTNLMTEAVSYCYKVMPFGLKNAGATYQRLMDRILLPMLERNVLAYINDMVVTSVKADDHIADLEELFASTKLSILKSVFSGYEQDSSSTSY